MLVMRLVVRVGEKQLGWKSDRVLVMKREVRVSSTIRVKEKQNGGRLGGVMGMRSAVPNSRPR